VFTPVRSSSACRTLGELGVEARERVAKLSGGPYRAQRVVLVHGGTPKTAITASPMNFSTAPPWRSITAFATSK
jgi:hypothetical protein